MNVGLTIHFQVELVWGVPEEIKANFNKLRDFFDR
jgi:hypothetical protein